mmetsp:Transcript_28125/g.61775  ORF Transcript_28125/g.61775 Transcript_28125/m.61775 type:complete len:224 (-) Transcript_28125:2828-3499(-)
MRHPSAASSSSVNNEFASLTLSLGLASSSWLERSVSARIDSVSDEAEVVPPSPHVTCSSSRTILGSHNSSPHPGAGHRLPESNAVWKHFGWNRCPRRHEANDEMSPWGSLFASPAWAHAAFAPSLSPGWRRATSCMVRSLPDITRISVGTSEGIAAFDSSEGITRSTGLYQMQAGAAAAAIGAVLGASFLSSLFLRVRFVAGFSLSSSSGRKSLGTAKEQWTR